MGCCIKLFLTGYAMLCRCVIVYIYFFLIVEYRSGLRAGVIQQCQKILHTHLHVYAKVHNGHSPI